VLDRTATAWLKRLLIWLEVFERDFSRQSQRGVLRRYVTGVLSDSRRKSMEAMWARLSDPGCARPSDRRATRLTPQQSRTVVNA
jgi:hypothetical protein